jgi:DNA-directed RNA polymerase specialized sigma24 family protein
MAAPSPFSAETLLEHEHFVRAVARGLLGDADATGDVLQETWLRTLQRGPRAGGNLRAWLARVAGNLARDRRRGSTRRALR